MRRWKAVCCGSTISSSRSRLADGTARTIRRDGDVPTVEVKDPLDGHRDLLSILTDANMHDVTAYLATLK